jgi:hypothetical protein
MLMKELLMQTKKKHRKHVLLLVTLQMKDVLQVNATNEDQ